MSLGRLLASGKSLVGVGNAASRYQTRKQVQLPKFVSPKNPFASVATSEAAAVSAPIPTPPTPTKSATPAPRAVASKVSAVKISVVKTVAAIGSGAVRLLVDWGAKLSPFQRRKPRNAPAPSKIPQFTQPSLPGELSLDRVKVVRNDFSDADLEIVPTRTTAVQPKAAATAALVNRLEPVGAAWNRLTTRVFGTEKTDL